MIHRQLGRYRILDRLGGGGMGEVWLAEDLELGRKVALKTLRRDVEMTPAQRARFEREARAVAALNHPNIVTLHSLEKEEGIRFLVMEYVDGKRLDECIPKGGLPPVEALRIGAAIADALAAAHAQGIVHRDLKPGNVLLTSDGRVKVVDFGLARALGAEVAPFAGAGRDSSLTHEGQTVGTLHYMSPEQLEGRAIDPRGDLFSLGVVLHEMLTGEQPFRGESAVQVISAILRDAPRPVDRGEGALPPGIAELVGKLLAKRAADRPQTAMEVRDRLLDGVRALGGNIDAAMSAGSGGWRMPARAGLRRATGVAAAGLAVAALVAIVLARRNAGPRPPDAPGAQVAPAVAVLPLANYSGDPDFFVDGMTDGVIGALARLESLRVISRQSVMHYKGSARPLPEIARELHVDYVVEASLRRTPGHFRVEAKLFRPDPERQVWSDSFDRADSEALALQADVARGVAGALQLLGPPESAARLAPARKVDPQVYEAYLRGRQLLEIQRPESVREARYLFEHAIRLDPDYAPAHVGLATAYWTLAYLFDDPATNAALQEMETRRALELQPDLAEAHVALGNHLRYFRWDWPGSEAAYRRALELDPSSVAARRGLWALLASLGRLPEAREQLEQARRLDPLSASIEGNSGYQALFEGNLDLAEQAFRRSQELDPAYLPANAGLWSVTDLRRQDPERREYLTRFLADSGHPDVAAELAALPASLGYVAWARRVGLRLEKLSATRRVSIGLGAAVLVSGGELDRAEAWLLRAYEKRDPEMVWLAADPTWAPLRQRPRIQEMIRQLRLTSGGD